MATIEEQRAQVQEARRQLEQRRKESQKAKQDLTKVKESLPERKSQRALRQNMSGLRGRQQRRNVLRAEKEIDRKKDLVLEYEKDLDQFETQVKQSEAQIRDYDERQNAIIQVKKAIANDKVWLLSAYGEGYVKQYARDYLEQKNLAEENQQFLINNPQILDAKIESLTSKGLTEEQAYNRLGLKLEAKATDIPEVKNILDSSIKLDDRTQNTKTKSSIFSTTGLSIVSAQSLNKSGGLKQNGNNNGVTGNFSGLDSGKQPSNRSGNWFSNIIGSSEDFKKNYQKEIYNPKLDAYVSASEPSGSATGIIRPNTPKLNYEVVSNPDSQYTKNIIGYSGGVPTTTYINTDSGLRAPPEIEKQLRSQEVGVKEVGFRLKDIKGYDKSKYYLSGSELIDKKTGKRTPYVDRSLGQYVENQAVRLFSKVTDPILEKLPEGAKNVLGRRTNTRLTDIAKFSLFAPAMSTATAQVTESAYSEVVVNGRRVFIKKSDLKDFLENPKISQSGKAIKLNDLTFQDKLERARVLLRNAKPEGREKVLQVIKESYGDDFVKDLVQQEGLLFNPIKTTPKIEVTGDVIRPVYLERTGDVGSFASAYSGSGQYEKTDSIVFKGSSLVPRQEDKQISILGNTPKLDSRSRQDISPLSNLNFKLDILSSQRLEVKTEQTPKTRQAQDFLFGQATIQDSATIQRTIQSSKTSQKPRETQKPIEKGFNIPKIKGDKIKPSKTSKSIMGNIFEAFAKVKGKEVSLGKSPTKKGATDKLKDFLGKTLSASGKVTKQGKPLEFNELGLGNQFRKGKNNPFKVVEKRSFRLNTPSEVFSIQSARKKSSKKKSKGINWLS